MNALPSPNASANVTSAPITATLIRARLATWTRDDLLCALASLVESIHYGSETSVAMAELADDLMNDGILPEGARC